MGDESETAILHRIDKNVGELVVKMDHIENDHSETKATVRSHGIAIQELKVVQEGIKTKVALMTGTAGVGGGGLVLVAQQLLGG